MKIFYSWQMDAPRKINKDFILHALNEAVSKLSEDPDISEAERDGLQVDQDTQGVLGSPEITRVIFDKIADSNVIVTDVSLVASGKDNKRHINSNVAIELGYAYGRLGYEPVLKIMNTHFGEPDDLPFDLRIRRHPVRYRLEPKADPETIAVERKKLVNELVGILKSYLASPPAKQPDKHVETPSTALRGMFWEPNEPLVRANDSGRRREVSWSGRRLLYFRCIPLTALPQLSSRDAVEMTTQLWPLVSSNGCSRSRNKWGALSYSVAPDGDLFGLSQLFMNREIWGVDAHYPSISTDPDDDGEPAIDYLPTGAIHRDYPDSIDSIRNLASKLGFGERYVIEMGLSGAEEMRLLTNNRYGDPYHGPIYEAEVYVREVIDHDYPTKSIMNEFWERLFSQAGSKVPDYLV